MDALLFLPPLLCTWCPETELETPQKLDIRYFPFSTLTIDLRYREQNGSDYVCEEGYWVVGQWTHICSRMNRTVPCMLRGLLGCGRIPNSRMHWTIYALRGVRL